ncbi:aspartate/glutamate racemase family protein [Anoxybacterium hadale]|uniref:Aspartate/glutamate racemase family protein n=1 Tax=Anoxybacterium hadale TaxID=3408580 RepID=A0ACD1AG90_9FIRM|nr:aspartate/glutamate racemase family protein [Clostridiales bacterium]
MKTIGLIGGMSWESTVTYYQVINEVIKEKLGGFHSAKILLYSVDFHEIEAAMAENDWERGTEILIDAAERLERGGADFIVICTNTWHKAAEQIREKVTIPVLHVAELIADELKERGLNTAALLGTRYTMEQNFYRNKLEEYGIKVMIPDEEERDDINRIIFEELCLGTISADSKERYLRIIDQLMQRGAEGIVLGCTEIGLLIQQGDTKAPLLDTAVIHARRAALYSIQTSL